MTADDLRLRSIQEGLQAINSTHQMRATVESYLKEMSVPAKYADAMFLVPKDELRWIGEDAFRADFDGVIWVPFKDGGTVHYVARSKLSPSQFSEQAKELEEHADELCQLRAALEREFSAMPELIRRKR